MSGETRIGDAEREAAIAALGEHYAAGRLTKQEYDERAEVAWSARTESALRPLFVDLPPLPGSRPAARQTPGWSTPAPPAPLRSARNGPKGWSPRLPVVPLVLLVLGLVLLTHVPWPLFLLLGVLWWSRGPGHAWRRR
jgi:hypothetical protein